MPFVIPPLVKLAVAVFGGAAAVYWAAKEFRRVNDELERATAAVPTMDAAARKALPTLRRDPATGVWRVG
jgi:hypothetical protein